MLFAQHELKLLNVGLIVYICMGALLFHSLGLFDETKRPTSPSAGSEGSTKAKSMPQASLKELRLDSVRRMWNITNQLNILYESNWTELILDELLQFERKFVDTLESELLRHRQGSSGSFNEDIYAKSESMTTNKHSNANSSQVDANDGGSGGQQMDAHNDNESSNGDGNDDDDDDDRSSRNKSNQKMAKKQDQNARRAKARLESLKKALVHSIATISTIVPIHYLCCSCNLLSCLRLISWLCCCCCCGYLCCLRSSNKKCCDSNPKKAPKLTLRSSERQRQGRQAVSSKASDEETQRRQQQCQADNTLSSPYVIGFNVPSSNQKSVRFVGHNQQPSNNLQDYQQQMLSHYVDEPVIDPSNDLDEGEHYDDSVFYTPGLVATSLSILVAYLALGSYYYSRALDITQVDALFSCFAMLSTSKLPDSFNLMLGIKTSDINDDDPINLIKATLQAQGSRRQPPSSTRGIGSTTMASWQGSKYSQPSTESLIRDSIYLLIGLNLVSTCAHFARLWLASTTSKKTRSVSRECPTAGILQPPATGQAKQSPPSQQNSLIGSYQVKQQHQQQQVGSTANSQQAASSPSSSNELTPSARNSARQLESGNYASHHLHHNSQQKAAAGAVVHSLTAGQQQQLDLTELFVLNGQAEGQQIQETQAQQSEPTDGQVEAAKVGAGGPLVLVNHRHNHVHNQRGTSAVPIVHSDGSFASDRSSDGRSLCSHHQATIAAATYGSQQQQQFYLPNGQPADLSSASSRLQLVDELGVRASILNLSATKEQPHHNHQHPEDDLELQHLKLKQNHQQQSMLPLGARGALLMLDHNGLGDSNTCQRTNSIGPEQQSRLRSSSSSTQLSSIGTALSCMEQFASNQQQPLDLYPIYNHDNQTHNLEQHQHHPAHYHLHQRHNSTLSNGTLTRTRNCGPVGIDLDSSDGCGC